MEEILNTVGDATKCPVALIINDGTVLLGHRHYTPDKWKSISVWTIPGGRCDAAETIETTLRREVAEEIGVTDLTIEEYLGEFPGAKEGDLVLVFRCSTNQTVQNMEPHKFSEWKWFGLNEFPESFINERVAPLVRSLLR